MRAAPFWKAVTVDRSDLLERFFALLRVHDIRFCLVGGQALNAYVEPVVSLDLDVVVAADQLTEVDTLVGREFILERFPHSLNVSDLNSDLRIQIQIAPRYGPFVDRASTREVLGHKVPVATPPDLLQGKLWALADTTRRGSNRQKDLADVARLLERFPELRAMVPPEVLQRLI